MSAPKILSTAGAAVAAVVAPQIACPSGANRYCWFQEAEPIKPRTIHIALTDPSLKEFYGAGAASYAGDSGLDLYVPADITVQPGETATIDHAIECAPQFPGGYYLYPRSSISKTPLRLANSVGIIDNGYRGHIMAKVDNRGTEPFTVRRGERLFQLCHPSLLPLTAVIVEEVDKNTERGAGGFGSTTKESTTK